MKYFTLSPIMFLFWIFCLKAHAQTTLVAGDIAFVGYNAINGSNDQSSFSFVILRIGGIANLTKINFTDNGWNTPSNVLTNTEGSITWTASEALPQYTEVKITATGQSSISVISSKGSATVTGDFILSSAGDQVLAYNGTLSSPTFIAGIHMNSEISGAGGQPASTANGWDAIATSNGPTGWAMTQNRSGIPPTLVNGVNAIMGVINPGALNAEFDNGVIDCNKAKGGSVNEIRTKLNNVLNWNFKNDTPNPYALPINCTYLAVLPIELGPINATINDGLLKVKWSTFSEQNNDHFEIQASTDGKSFNKMGTVKSKATAGNSNITLNYDFSIALAKHQPLNSLALIYVLGIPLMFIGRKKMKSNILMLLLLCSVTFVACQKNNDTTPMAGQEDIFIRIAQFDKDGMPSHSVTVLAVPNHTKP